MPLQTPTGEKFGPVSGEIDSRERACAYAVKTMFGLVNGTFLGGLNREILAG
jgi:hypothetical protein